MKSWMSHPNLMLALFRLNLTPKQTEEISRAADQDEKTAAENLSIRDLTEEQITAWLASNQQDGIIKSLELPNGPGKQEVLLNALRFGLAGWALTEATPEQILDTVDRNRKSPNN